MDEAHAVEAALYATPLPIHPRDLSPRADCGSGQVNCNNGYCCGPGLVCYESNGQHLCQVSNSYLTTSAGSAALATVTTNSTGTSSTTSATASTSSSTNDAEHGSSSLSGGAIAGIVIGAVAGLTLIIGAVIFVLRKRRQLQVKERDEATDGTKKIEKLNGDSVASSGNSSAGPYTEEPGKIIPMYGSNAGIKAGDYGEAPELQGDTEQPTISPVNAQRVEAPPDAGSQVPVNMGVELMGDTTFPEKGTEG